ncbi:homocysteine S-methyltransferase family protein [Clostridiaceae bacterium NSJ-31]|uniref:Homocysteine S-methyltransferase family protein n=3 Tax=Ligaoa zhengdingensis TaxID=2763658 RepID=A0A926DZ66_9FIRM|nr:homocysteine S-methyltransferase family protein [Ligaoa zhengdingensis]MBC8546264.1 homocysteine S-methyltransferase family protein [Ligaoa zhengdingensis]
MKFPYPLPMLLDGATGTNLIAAGMPQSACVERWILEHPDVLQRLQREFVAAGADAVYAPTFSANAAKLAHYGLEGQVRELNLRLAALSREAVGDSALVGGDLSPTGLFCEPFGDTPFLDLVHLYAEQALALRDAGVDFLAIETMTSMTGMRAAILGGWHADLPIFVTLTVDESGRTLSGADLLAALLTAQSMGAAAFGVNCSTGAEGMQPLFERLAPHARVPLIAKPNAGLPDPATGAYRVSPDEMAARMAPLFEAGVTIAGGCCGTTPAHLAAIGRAMRGFDFDSVQIEREEDALVVCSETEVFYLDEDFELSEPVDCELDMTDALMDAGGEGCDAISVHLTSNEDAYCFAQNMHMASLPVSFLAETEEALEAGLIYYNGRALIDSRSEVPRERMEELAVGYGAVLR